ncbi:ABC transporter permease [Aureimonas endophytica]|uniref:ABC transporter permease n=1 Tax=Aureimonas endophytica TaxID=2027858 RepID=A0A916ZSX8_9HYPH|nr:ABC transporter permease [Aureimonas endophytica]GGE12521.1 ABC transporter permease [Aureimonas endophytica]
MKGPFGRLFRDGEMLAGAAILAGLVLAAAFGPLLWRIDPLDVDVLASLSPPTLDHPMGTDDVGRDVLARFIGGARVSLTVSFVVTLIGTAIGGALGLVAGFSGGWLDLLLSRVMDAILAFPPLILAMAVAIGLGPGVSSAVIGIVLAAIPWYYRLLRGEVMRIRGLAFIDAARVLGVSRPRIILRHVLPQTVSTLLIQASSVFSFSILTLAALGFVGLGIQPPLPEWGTMITEGLAYALTGQWWLGLFPGLGIFLLAAAANLLADRLRDAQDPKSAKGAP